MIMDLAIYHQVLAILYEMSSRFPISIEEDWDAHDEGPFRVYSFHLSMRDDVDTGDFIKDFSSAVEQHSTAIKLAFAYVASYPGTTQNWSSVYLTVVIL